MPKNKTFPLFDLIQSMSPNEKRSFKLYSKKEGGKTDKNYIELFDILASLKSYNEKKLIDQLKNPLQAKNIAQSKIDLYRILLRFMRDYYGGKDRKQKPARILIHEYWSDIHILLERGLTQAAQEKWQEAEAIMEEHQFELDLLEIIQIKRKYARQFTTKNPLKIIQELKEKTNHHIDRVTLEFELLDIYDQSFIADRYKEEAILTTAFEAVTKLVHHADKKKLTLRAALSYHFICAKYYEKARQYKEAASQWSQAINLLEKHTALNNENIDRYLNTLNNYFDNLLLSDLISESIFSNQIKKLHEIHSKSEYIQSKIRQHYHYYYIQYNYANQNVDDIIKIDTQIIDLLNADHNIPPAREATFHYLMACSFLVKALLNKQPALTSGFITKAQEWVNRNFGNAKLEAIKDLHIRSKILLALTYYESEIDSLAESTIKSTLHYLQKLDDKEEYIHEKFLLNQLKKIIYQLETDRKSLFEKILNDKKRGLINRADLNELQVYIKIKLAP